MAKINWKTFREIEQEKQEEEANRPLTVEEQVANLFFSSAMQSGNIASLEQKNAQLFFDAALKQKNIEEVEKNSANVMFILAKNGIF